MRKYGFVLLFLAAAVSAVGVSRAGHLPYEGTNGSLTGEPAMLNGDTDNTGAGWTAQPLLTIGESVNGYKPLGILDGIGAFALTPTVVRVLVNHEVGASLGRPYTLASGAQLTGARISYIDLGRFNRRVRSGDLAFDTVYDRAGQVVTSGAQINENSGSETDGFERFCSAWFGAAGDYGLVDDIYFTGEETAGGQCTALDVRNGDLYVVPMLGRAAFENVVMIDPPAPEKVAFLIGDDRQGAPLYLYIGTKDAIGDGSFLDRNGLARGELYAWVSDSGDQSPQDFHGTGSEREGGFARIVQYDPGRAGQPGYDAVGYADQSTIDALVAAAGAYHFSRPEDLSTNPQDGLQVAFASTGRGQSYPADNWGDTFIVDVSYANGAPRAHVKLVYDGDDAGNGQFAGPDYGLRSPDNVDWSDDGHVYICEDRSTSPGSLFGAQSGAEASVWRLDAATGVLTRILEVDRTAVPTGQQDTSPTDIGNWESSGVLDVTDLFSVLPGETLLLVDVQAHSLVGDPLGGANQGGDLVEGGQLTFLTNSTNDGAMPSDHGNIRPADRAYGPRSEGKDVPLAGIGAGGAILLYPNAPNPARPSTTFSFSLPADGHARLEVVDIEGRVVKTVIDSHLSGGSHSYSWDGVASSGRPAEAGVYFYKLTTARGTLHGKMLITK